MAKLIYAFGDLHGRSDLLRAAERKIIEGLRSGPARDVEFVYLGDYGDRGPDSQGVYELIGREIPGVRKRRLRGNHEDCLAAFLTNGDQDKQLVFCQHGGPATIRSYGIKVDDGLGDVAVRQHELRAALIEAMPSRHLAVLAGTELLYRYQDTVFVHAGLRPGVPLAQQTEKDLMWDRTPFEPWYDAANEGYQVVHGHTPVKMPKIEAGRISVDTGAYGTGRLSVAVVGDGPVRFIVTDESERLPQETVPVDMSVGTPKPGTVIIAQRAGSFDREDAARVLTRIREIRPERVILQDPNEVAVRYFAGPLAGTRTVLERVSRKLPAAMRSGIETGDIEVLGSGRLRSVFSLYEPGLQRMRQSAAAEASL